MFQNYCKIAWRNLFRNKTFTLLNITGLATGMAVALLIGLWALYQFSFDQFLPNYERLYQVRYRTHFNGVAEQTMATAIPLAATIKQQIPGIANTVTTDWTGTHALSVADKKISLAGSMVTSEYFTVFPYPFLKGNASTALQDPYSIVLTAATSKALFGTADPINRMVRVDNRHDLKVTGVIQDVPENASFPFSYLIPFEYYKATEPWVQAASTNWENSFLTFITLKPNVSLASVQSQLNHFLGHYDKSNEATELLLQPAKDWHLRSVFANGLPSGGMIDYVNIFSIVGLLVLIIACINFMNLSTARSEKRAKEVGIRKAVGSLRISLVVQFLLEAMLLTTIAGVMAIVMVELALPAFNNLTRTDIHVPYASLSFWITMLVYILITGLLAGSKPAFYLSSFKPIAVLKGSIQPGKQATLSRKMLVVLQFSSSIALIAGTVIIYQQIQFAKNRPTGLDTNRLVVTAGNADLDRNYVALKNDLLQSGMVGSITRASAPTTELNIATAIDQWQDKLPNERLIVNVVMVSDADYFKTLGMQFVEGNNFSPNDSANGASVILNEALIRQMRLKSSINQPIAFWGNRQTIIGVVKNALATSPFTNPKPTIYTYTHSFNRVPANYIYRIAANANIHKALKQVSSIFNKYNPASPFQYTFTDESYAAKFTTEVLMGKMAWIFSMLCIFISCLGLFGLAAYMAEQRKKEIGIRKVLGASAAQLWMLLSNDFIVLILISAAIGSPVAFYFTRHWLQQYDYRIAISPLVFLFAGVVAIAITILTISFQALKAVRSNPANSLRAE